MSKKVIVKQQSSQAPRTTMTFRSPIDFLTACIPVVLSYLFAYSHNIIHSYTSSHPILPYCPQAPKNPTSNQARPAFPAPQIKHPRVSANSLRRLPARYRMSRRGTSPTRPASGLSRSTHPTRLLKYPGGHGYGIAWRCDDGVCVAVGPCIQARLEAGNCEEGFACLFQDRPYSRIRSALAVPCFFVAGCPRRVCRDSYSIFGLF